MTAVHEPIRLQSGPLTLVGERWVVEAGEHGTVVLLHGSGQTRHSWRRTAKSLAAHGWSSVTIDMRGHGESSWAPDGDYTPDAIADDLACVVRTLDAPPVLVGASLGGIGALVLEADHHVASHLVLADVAPVLERRGSDKIFEFMSQARDGFDTLEEAATVIGAYAPRSRPANLEGLRRNLRLGEDGKWRWHWDPRLLDNAGPGHDELVIAEIRDAARRVTVPTLLVRGTTSEIFTERGAAEMQRLMPHAALVEVDAGHMVTGDDNDVFARHLLAFLG